MSSLVFSQSWRTLPNAPVGQYWNHDDITFIDEDRGWVCDISGRIYRTVDGGDSWELMIHQDGTSFRCIAFLDSLNGFSGTLGPGGWVNNTNENSPSANSAQEGNPVFKLGFNWLTIGSGDDAPYVHTLVIRDRNVR